MAKFVDWRSHVILHYGVAVVAINGLCGIPQNFRWDGLVK